MVWSPQQEQALKKVKQWLRDPNRKQVFRLFGFAGTGKTTLARALTDDVNGKVVFGAFTGKAALVLSSKGCTGASTIHSMIYKLVRDEDTGIEYFKLNNKGPAARADLIVIDEVSMVDEKVGRDLLSLERPVLVLGDPAQLPPVKGTGFFTEAEPDVMLTEIHRQAKESPIIHMATKVRQGGRLNCGEYAGCRVMRNFEDTDLAEADQVICGLNRTRQAGNDHLRRLLGITAPHPVEGDRLICLKNDRNKGILNGGGFAVRTVIDVSTDWNLVVQSTDGIGTQPIEITTHPAFFRGSQSELSERVQMQYDQFDYGYYITCHKAQGSQWGNPLVLNESYVFRDQSWRWLYTAITRAAERITIIQ